MIGVLCDVSDVRASAMLLYRGVYPFGDDGTAAGGEDERRLAGHVNTVGFGYPVNPSALSWRAPCS